MHKTESLTAGVRVAYTAFCAPRDKLKDEPPRSSLALFKIVTCKCYVVVIVDAVKGPNSVH